MWSILSSVRITSSVLMSDTTHLYFSISIFPTNCNPSPPSLCDTGQRTALLFCLSAYHCGKIYAEKQVLLHIKSQMICSKRCIQWESDSRPYSGLRWCVRWAIRESPLQESTVMMLYYTRVGETCQENRFFLQSVGLIGIIKKNTYGLHSAPDSAQH